MNGQLFNDRWQGSADSTSKHDDGSEAHHDKTNLRRSCFQSDSSAWFA